MNRGIDDISQADYGYTRPLLFPDDVQMRRFQEASRDDNDVGMSTVDGGRQVVQRRNQRCLQAGALQHRVQSHGHLDIVERDESFHGIRDGAAAE